MLETAVDIHSNNKKYNESQWLLFPTYYLVFVFNLKKLKTGLHQEEMIKCWQRRVFFFRWPVPLLLDCKQDQNGGHWLLSSVVKVNQSDGPACVFQVKLIKKEALLVKLVKEPGGTPVKQHPVLTTCILNSTCAGHQLCCCFDQPKADQMNLWEAILGFLCLGNEFQGFRVGHRIYFWKHLRLFCLQMLFVCLFMFLCTLGYIFKDSVPLTTHQMLWVGLDVWSGLKKMLQCMFD